MPRVMIPPPFQGPTRGQGEVKVEGGTIRECLEAKGLNRLGTVDHGNPFAQVVFQTLLDLIRIRAAFADDLSRLVEKERGVEYVLRCEVLVFSFFGI